MYDYKEIMKCLELCNEGLSGCNTCTYKDVERCAHALHSDAAAAIEELTEGLGKERKKTMKRHDLKVSPINLQDITYGFKTFELVKDDGNYKTGDTLILWEYENGKYSGLSYHVMVKYISKESERYGLKDGYVILGIQRSEPSQLELDLEV